MSDLVCETLGKCPSCGGGSLARFDAEARLDRCGTCGLVFDNPRPDAASIAAFYSRQTQYDGWLCGLAARERLWARRWKRLRPFLPAGGSILDVGAGIGQFLSQAGPGWTADGTELSPVARRLARERWNIELREGILEDLALPEASYDAVTLFHVLEHVPFPGRTLDEIHRILKPGGSVVIAVPDEWGAATARLHRCMRLVGAGFAGRGRSGIRTIHTKEGLEELHLSRFRPSSLRQLLTGHGFDVALLGPDPHQPPVGTEGLVMDVSWNLSRMAMAVSENLNFHPAILAVARRRP